jgi:metallophosphoesterase (TIGR00282 family)
VFKVLFIGDVVGRPGRTWLKEKLAGLREALDVDLVVANGENAAAGAGITRRLAEELLAAGVDGLTLGDHTWDQRGFEKEIESLEKVCRPANMAPSNPGRSTLLLEAAGRRVGVFTVLGRQFMKPRDCPFLAADRLVEELNDQADMIIAEIHAEATSEKIAFGRFLDGRVTAVLGTHTHVATADASLLPNGTAYMTDVGMTGPHDSVIGRDVKPVIEGFLDGLPRRFAVASRDVRLSGALLEIDDENRCKGIRPVSEA